MLALIQPQPYTYNNISEVSKESLLKNTLYQQTPVMTLLIQQ